MAIPISSSYSTVDPNFLFYEGFELTVDNVIPSMDLTSSFDPNKDKVEFYIYNSSKKLLYQNENFTNYIVANNIPSPELPLVNGDNSVDFNALELDPTSDVYTQGYGTGNYYAVYNFTTTELGSENPYYISEISSDRTELRLKNNYIPNIDIEGYYIPFASKLSSNIDFDEFYIDFGSNKYFIAINSELEIADNAEVSVLIKLYKPLSSDYKLLDTLSVKSKIAETNAYEIKFTEDLGIVDDLIYLKGPNIDVNIKDRINNSTEFKTLTSLDNANSSGSYEQYLNLKKNKGANIRVDYGNFSEFIHFSSAEQRLNNFRQKRILIEGYEKELNDLNTITGTAVGTSAYSSSKESVASKIKELIENFDGYDYYLTYITGSESWPKQSDTLSTSNTPYPLYSYSSSKVKNWLGSSDENDPYFGVGKNQLNSASLYDENNTDYLKHLMPTFISNDPSNDPYFKFVGMTGQSFDEMWIYTQAIKNLRNTSNPLTGSVLSLDLAADAIESLGWDTYGNSFNSQLFDPNEIGQVPPTGSGKEYITRYVDAASGSVVNYYDSDFTTLGYIIQLANPGYPYPVDGPQKEIYKRIFSDMVSLVKRKGTITGLRQLINIWGVPATCLRISEFGGKNKDDEGDYDLWMDRSSTYFSTYPNKKQSDTIWEDTNNALSAVKTPWAPLTKNYYEAGGTNVKAFDPFAGGGVVGGTYMPDSIQFRFKPATKVGADTHFSESLMYCWDNQQSVGNFGITLQYSGSQTGSYSGSVKGNISDPYQTYASMSFVISGSVSQGGSGLGYFKSSPIYLPFYNGDWWSVQIQRLNHITASISSSRNYYELKVGQKGYEGYDGNQLKYQGSSTIEDGPAGVTSSMHQAWNHGAAGGNVSTAIRAARIGEAGSTHLYFPSANTSATAWSQTSSLAQIGQGASLAPIVGTPKRYDLGQHFSGSYQEIRYYTHAVSQSSFNDFVMNPESIQGQNGENTGRGPGTSYYNLAYRVPLGNENEYSHIENNRPTSGSIDWSVADTMLLFGSQSSLVTPSPDQTHNASIGSVHPSIVNKRGSLYTSSFVIVNPNAYTQGNNGYGTTGSSYEMQFHSSKYGNLSSSLTASFINPQDEVVYMDQPSAGIRNRITNKIEIVEGNSYGTILSPLRSIQQNPIQSQSYTEDLNSLEVGFSFQNEISDDIIATYGHGVVSDAIADPRFISESSDRYPELDRISRDYFLKYQGPIGQNNINPNWDLPSQVEREWDYNRLIKFYETSLFKAIKNYIPARTSLSTGIIVKQHLLERNRQKIPTFQIGQNLGVSTSETKISAISSPTTGQAQLKLYSRSNFPLATYYVIMLTDVLGTIKYYYINVNPASVSNTATNIFSNTYINGYPDTTTAGVNNCVANAFRDSSGNVLNGDPIDMLNQLKVAIESANGHNNTITCVVDDQELSITLKQLGVGKVGEGLLMLNAKNSFQILVPYTSTPTFGLFNKISPSREYMINPTDFYTNGYFSLDKTQGWNQFDIKKNIEVTGSTEKVVDLGGGAGGSVNSRNNTYRKLITNKTINESLGFKWYAGFSFVTNTPTNDWECVGENNGVLYDKYIQDTKAIEGHSSTDNWYFQSTEILQCNNLYLYLGLTIPAGGTDIQIRFRSSKRGVIMTTLAADCGTSPLTNTELLGINQIDIQDSQWYWPCPKPFTLYPDEKIFVEWKKIGGGAPLVGTLYINIAPFGQLIPTDGTVENVQTQTWGANNQSWLNAIDTPVGIITGSSAYNTSQNEFYDGEYSGSTIRHRLDEYNPYRIYADGENFNPDAPEIISASAAVGSINTGTQFAGKFSNTTQNSGESNIIRCFATSSFETHGSFGTVNNRYIGITGSGGIRRTFMFSEAGGGCDGGTVGSWTPLMGVPLHADESPSIESNTGIESSVGSNVTDGTYTGIIFPGYFTTNNGNNVAGSNLEATFTIAAGKMTYITFTEYDGHPTGVGQYSNQLKLSDATGNNLSTLWGYNATYPDGGSGTNDNVWIRIYTQVTGTSTYVNKGTWCKNVDLEQYGGGIDSAKVAAAWTAAFIDEGPLVTSGYINTADAFILATEQISGSRGGDVGRGSNRGISSDNIYNLVSLSGFAASTATINIGGTVCNDTIGLVYLTSQGAGRPKADIINGMGGHAADPGSAGWYIEPSMTSTGFIQNGRQYKLSFDLDAYSHDGGSGNLDMGWSAQHGIPSTVNVFRTLAGGAATLGTYTGVFTATADGAVTWPRIFVSSGVSASFSKVKLNQLEGNNFLHPKFIQQYSSIKVQPTSSLFFENSDYNPLNNNVSQSRGNKFYQDMNFEGVQNIPNNYILISKSLAPEAPIPESFFTQQSSILPRYEGSTLSGLDYNNYNYSTEGYEVYFLNGDTGSWSGDVSFGTDPVVSSYPIYFAHFNTSQESLERFNKTRFEIDQLIRVPMDPLSDQESPNVDSIDISGDNSKLQEVTSTFVDTRQVKILFSNASKTFDAAMDYLGNKSGTKIKYSDIIPGSKKISTAATDFITNNTTQLSRTKLFNTQSFNFPSWLGQDSKDLLTGNQNLNQEYFSITESSTHNSGRYTENLAENVNGDVRWQANISTEFSQIGCPSFQTGSSTAGDAKGYGLLEPTGGWSILTNAVEMGSLGFGVNYLADQNTLALMNAINHGIYNGKIINSPKPPGYLTPTSSGFGVSFGSLTGSDYYEPPGIGFTGANNFPTPFYPASGSQIYTNDGIYGLYGSTLPVLDKNLQTSRKFKKSGRNLKDKGKKAIRISAEEKSNYFTQNFQNTTNPTSTADRYNVNETPLMIEKGDIIRVAYRTPLAGKQPLVYSADAVKTSNFFHQDFKVMGYEDPAPAINTRVNTITGPLGGTTDFICNGLPEKGIYSPEELFKRYSTAAENRSMYAVTSTCSTSSGTQYAGSGSIESVEIMESIAQNISSQGSNPQTGSIKLNMKVISRPNHILATNISFYIGTTNTLQRQIIHPTGTYIKNTGIGYYNNCSLWAQLSGSTFINITTNPILLVDEPDAGFTKSRIMVEPNPATLQTPIPYGSIYSYSLLKREESDNKVYVDLTYPTGSKGSLTPSGDGYLIPEDLSYIQKQNVQKLINQLKSKNSFTSNDSNTQS